MSQTYFRIIEVLFFTLDILMTQRHLKTFMNLALEEGIYPCSGLSATLSEIYFEAVLHLTFFEETLERVLFASKCSNSSERRPPGAHVDLYFARPSVCVPSVCVPSSLRRILFSASLPYLQQRSGVATLPAFRVPCSVSHCWHKRFLPAQLLSIILIFVSSLLLQDQLAFWEWELKSSSSVVSMFDPQKQWWAQPPPPHTQCCVWLMATQRTLIKIKVIPVFKAAC